MTWFRATKEVVTFWLVISLIATLFLLVVGLGSLVLVSMFYYPLIVCPILLSILFIISIVAHKRNGDFSL